MSFRINPVYGGMYITDPMFPRGYTCLELQQLRTCRSYSFMGTAQGTIH
jgi:hypothetical protein